MVMEFNSAIKKKKFILLRGICSHVQCRKCLFYVFPVRKILMKFVMKSCLLYKYAN